MSTKEKEFIEVYLPLSFNYYEDYLRWLFRGDNPNYLQISKSTNIGKFIISKVEVTLSYPKKTGLRLRIPNTRFHTLLPSKFYCFSNENVDEINSLINFYFDSDFREFMLTGMEMGIFKSTLYREFARSRNLIDSDDLFEMLKQRDYRRRLKVKTFLNKRFNDKILS